MFTFFISDENISRRMHPRRTNNRRVFILHSAPGFWIRQELMTASETHTHTHTHVITLHALVL